MVDTLSTRLAADVAALRIVERDWPADQFVGRRDRLREQIRESEINDEPGRGPLRRFLTKVQRMQVDFVPTAAMAFQELRRSVVKFGEEEEPGEFWSSAYETPVGTLMNFTVKLVNNVLSHTHKAFSFRLCRLSSATCHSCGRSSSD